MPVEVSVPVEVPDTMSIRDKIKPHEAHLRKNAQIQADSQMWAKEVRAGWQDTDAERVEQPTYPSRWNAEDSGNAQNSWSARDAEDSWDIEDP